jgi:hypothetical protein
MSGGFPVPKVSSHHFSKPLRCACCSCHSRALRRRSRSAAAAFFIWSTQPATVRIMSEMSAPSAFAMLAFSVNSCEKWPRNSCEAVDTYDERVPTWPSIALAVFRMALPSASAVASSNSIGSVLACS